MLDDRNTSPWGGCYGNLYSTDSVSIPLFRKEFPHAKCVCMELCSVLARIFRTWVLLKPPFASPYPSGRMAFLPTLPFPSYT